MSKAVKLQTSEAMVLLSAYIDRMVQEGKAPEPQSFLDRCPNGDKGALPRYLNAARLMYAAIGEIRIPSEEEFDSMWANILTRLEELGEI